RIPIYLLSLLGSNVKRRGRLLIAWFGPRGLSSLLLILLPVFAGLPGSERLFQVCAFVVLLSVVIHGGSPMLLARFCKPKEKEDETPDTQIAEMPAAAATAAPTVAAPATATMATTPTAAPEVGPNTITLEDLDRLRNAGQQVILLDVRTERSIETSESMAQGAVRMPPEHVAAQARELKLPKEAWLIAYCA
ncbi:MAG TPA: hypothetical protein VLB87_14510, partial [Pyrinomonadaceae bacterium]|nr:hypothetical protein [Pyrinomonadaceae bacterium]